MEHRQRISHVGGQDGLATRLIGFRKPFVGLGSRTHL